MITELVNFSVSESMTDDQLKLIADKLISNFWTKQDVFIDAKLVKNVKDSSFCFIYNFQSLDGVTAVGDKMRSSNEFIEFMQLIDPASIEVTFHNQLKTW